jgi:hypothetical protein
MPLRAASHPPDVLHRQNRQARLNLFPESSLNSIRTARNYLQMKNSF